MRESWPDGEVVHRCMAVDSRDNCSNQAWLLKKSLQWQKLPKLGDQKCIPRWRKSFIGHPSASSFQGEDAERVFQQPRLITTVISSKRAEDPCCQFGKQDVRR
jgi:hypothetical protein